MEKKAIVATVVIICILLAVLLLPRGKQEQTVEQSPVNPFYIRWEPASPLAAQDELDFKTYIPHYYTQARLRLDNPGFEAGRWYVTRWWWWPSIYAASGAYPEIQPGEDWTAWWVEHYPTGDTYTGRPEVKVIALSEGFPDANRIAEGDRALQWFQFWRTGWGGVYQLAVFPAGTWRVCAQAHAWYSNCDNSPEGPTPLDYDCKTPIADAHLLFNVGVDVLGRYDYWRVVWGPGYERYGTYSGEYACSPWFKLDYEPNDVTVWLKCQSNLPLKHGDCYFDDVRVERLP